MGDLLSAQGGGGGGGATSLTNANGGTVAAGSPVYSAGAGTFDKAKADSLSTSALIIGLLQADTATTASGDVQDTSGLTLTTGQWDARTGQTGGLTPDAAYYVDPTTAGKLTSVAPTTVGQVVAPIGVALSTTIMLVRIGQSVLL